MDAQNLFLFLGSGASFVGEAGLPLFWQIRSHIVEQLVPLGGIDPTDNLFESLVRKMAPESFFHAFVDANVNVVRALVGTFNANSPHPNAIHRACASLLANGAVAWTTNYDTLIEEACEAHRFSPLAWNSPELRPSHYDIAKPHGSLAPRVSGAWPADPSPQLVFETKQLLADLPAEWADALFEQVHGKGVVIVGYSGADIDIAPHLTRALDAAEWVVWFATPSEEASLLRRFDLGRRFGPSGGSAMSLTANPSESFLAWLKSEALISKADPCPPNWRPNMAGFDRLDLPELVRADVLANLGLARTSKSLYRSLSRSLRVPIRDRVTAYLRLARRNAALLRRKEPGATVMRGLSLLPRWAPGTGSARRLAVEDTRTADSWPTTYVLERWFAASDKRTYRAIGLGLIRRLRYEGRLQEARARAEWLLNDSRFENPSPNHVAGFSFQLTEILRMQGDMTAAVELIERGFSRLLGTSLVLWEEFEDVACRIQRFDMSSEIGNQLVMLARSFSRIDEPLGQETIAMAHAIHRRQRGDYSGALVTLMLLAESTRDESPLLHDGALFHCAETFRLLGQDAAALVQLDAMDGRWYLHDPFGKILRALLNPPAADRSELLGGAHAQFVKNGCPWGQAIAADMAAHLSVDIGLTAAEIAQARGWFARQGTPSYSSDPTRWTFAMV